MGEKLKVAGELTPGASDSLGYRLNLPQVWSVEGEDSIRLPQLGLLNNNRLSLMIPRLRHFNLLLLNLF